MGLGLYVLIQLFFAGLCTCHAWLSWELFKKDKKRGLFGLVIPPLAPYHGVNLGIPKLPFVWVTFGATYLVLLVLALLLPESR